MMLKGAIQLPKDTPNSIYQFIKEMLKNDNNFSNISSGPAKIYFDLSAGDKISYEILYDMQYEIMALLEHNSILKKGFHINAIEYPLTGNGYDYNYGEEKQFSITKPSEIISPDAHLVNADVVARLSEEIARLQSYLINHGHEMPKNARREISLRLIAFQKILKGDKPKDIK